MLKKIYLVIGVFVLMMYAASGLFGWEMRGSNGRSIKDIQKSPGGIRGFYLWHSRYHGGK